MCQALGLSAGDAAVGQKYTVPALVPDEDKSEHMAPEGVSEITARTPQPSTCAADCPSSIFHCVV